jgi:hypothetical protein
MLGTAAVGYLTWALSTAYFATKVGGHPGAHRVFPLFSRLQHDTRAGRRVARRMIQRHGIAVFAWIGLCLGLGEQLTTDHLLRQVAAGGAGPDDLRRAQC